MNILIVEDVPETKLMGYEELLYALKVKYKIVGSKEEAINYIEEKCLKNNVSNENCIDGIILDLGFPEFKNGRNYDEKMGLQVIEYLKKYEINIPVIINSTTKIKSNEVDYKYLYGQSQVAYNPQFLNSFFVYIYSM